jgi:uncharacterized protein
MKIMRRFLGAFAALVIGCGVCWCQASRPKLVDCHVHYNSDPAFLDQLVAKLKTGQGVAMLITAPKDIQPVSSYIKAHPGWLIPIGELKLDQPDAVEMVDRFHQAGFRGLGEMSGPQYPYDDRRYWPIYERAERYHMILLFHTGIVNRTHPEIPTDVSSDRMRVGTLDLIARRFPKLTIIGAHLGNPDYAWAGEIARWNPNVYFDVSGSTLIKKQEDYKFFKSIFWWTTVASPHTPKASGSAFEKLVFGSDVFEGDLGEFDRELSRYHHMLDASGVAPDAQANIFAGTLWKILQQH